MKYNNIEELLTHKYEIYKKDMVELYDLGKKASAEVKELYKKIDVELYKNDCLSHYYKYKVKSAWQRGNGSSKITHYFSYILKHNDFKDIGSSIDITILLEEEKGLVVYSAITNEYNDENDMFDPIIQEALEFYATKEFVFNSHRNNRHKWNSLDKEFIVDDYKKEDDLIKDIVISIKKIITIFDSIIENEIKKVNNQNSVNYKFHSSINSNPQVQTKQYEPTNSNTRVDGEKKARENKIVGDYFENKVLEYETNKLKNTSKVPCKAKGDGYGYDIESYDENGDQIYIEVKGTKRKRETPFFISSTEIAAAKKYGDKWFLYRVYKKGDNINIEVFNAKTVLDNFRINPSEYEVILEK